MCTVAAVITVTAAAVDLVIKGVVCVEDISPIDEKVDVWSFGVTVYELVTGVCESGESWAVDSCACSRVLLLLCHALSIVVMTAQEEMTGR